MAYSDFHLKAIKIFFIIGIILFVILSFINFTLAFLFFIISIACPSAAGYAINAMEKSSELTESEGCFMYVLSIFTFLVTFIGSAIFLIAFIKSTRIILFDRLKKKANAGNQEAQTKLAIRAEDLYKKGLTIQNKFGYAKAKTWFKCAADLGHNAAMKEINEIQNFEENKREQEHKAKEERLKNLPKCPKCGKPIEKEYVNQFWGSRYMHAVYAPDCDWMDDKLRNPYEP